MKIGVIGGTFDPVHLGHIAIARAAVSEYGLDRLWFMPAGDPYFKEGSGVTSPALRYEMTRQCVEALPDSFECSDFELAEEERTYSAITFQRLNTFYPEDSFFFIMGLDSLRSLHKWYRPELLLANTAILCAARNQELESGTDIEAVVREVKDQFSDHPGLKPDIRVIHTPTVDISSTMIRGLVREGQDISQYVTKETENFIREHGLYLSPENRHNIWYF